ncbi:MAG: hypothetical protein H7Z12_17940 [Rhodospirillaceae bacterium]|nr:hypothetical protein [Rhodospirillales bacterium]
MNAHRFIQSPTHPSDITRNSIQVNVISVIDVARAAATGSLDGALMFVDNSVDQAGQPSPGRGTLSLVTQCNQGMVINWILETVGPYGTPVPASIRNIQFDEQVCFKLQTYGAVDVEHSPDYLPGVTPSYSYWAGLLRPDLKPKRYRYRIEYQIGTMVLGVSTPSLDVWDVPVQLAPSSTSTARERAAARIVG